MSPVIQTISTPDEALSQHDIPHRGNPRSRSEPHVARSSAGFPGTIMMLLHVSFTAATLT
jgi:hypothetical protein